jgi:hypothetical protein
MLRNDFAGCSTGNSPNSYYETKGAALRAFESVLDDHGLCYDPDDFLSMPNDDGRIEIAIFTYDAECDETIACVGRAILVWHRMENSGRYEFIGYLA